MSWPFSMVALIPARAGSKRIPGKNTKLFAGHPLLAYTIAAAQQSGVFSRVYVATDDARVDHNFMKLFSDSTTFSHHRAPVMDRQADVEWVREVLWAHEHYDTFAILRPTSPFRTAETVRRAFKQFTLPDQTADSIRAVEPCKQHPGKMWEWAGPGSPITPLLHGKRSDEVPWHSCPTQTLPTFYIQNSSLEIGWTSNVEVHGTIHGRKVAPFFTEGYEGFSLDYPEDWERAEALIASGRAVLPTVTPKTDEGLRPETVTPTVS